MDENRSVSLESLLDVITTKTQIQVVSEDGQLIFNGPAVDFVKSTDFEMLQSNEVFVLETKSLLIHL